MHNQCFLVGLFTVVQIIVSCKTPAVSDPSAAPQNRYVLGAAHSYVPMKNVDPQRAKASIAYRRCLAWKVVQNLWRSVPVRNVVGLGAKELAVWQTWYDSHEVREIYRAYRQLLFERKDRKPCPPASTCQKNIIAKAFKVHAAKEIGSVWYEKVDGKTTRLDQFLGQIKGHHDLAGLIEQVRPVGGTLKGISLFSPGLVAHLLAHSDQIIECYKAAKPCKLPRMPDTAVALKTTWLRTNALPKNAIRTDAAALTAMLKTGSWLEKDQYRPQLVAPTSATSDDFLRMRVETPDGTKLDYALIGMHIMTKDLPDWLWISLWWSNAGRKNFGADQPSALVKRAKQFANYKACSVADFVEIDKNPRFVACDAETSEPVLAGLASAYSAVRKHMGENSWCSNPFIEVEEGHGATNCLGCHQHAGVSSNSSTTSVRKTRKEFFSDYLWSLTMPPDNLIGEIGAEDRAIETYGF